MNSIIETVETKLIQNLNSLMKNYPTFELKKITELSKDRLT